MITPNFWPVVYMKTRVKKIQWTRRPGLIMEVPFEDIRRNVVGQLCKSAWGTWQYTCLCQLSNQEPDAGPLGDANSRPSHKSCSSAQPFKPCQTVHKIFMDQGASVSELMILWAATGEAPLDLSGELRDPCDHQIISS